MLAELTGTEDDVARAAWAWTGAIRLEKGDVRGAIEAAEKAFALDRNDAVATFVVAMALAGKDDPRAATWLERARVLAPSNEIVARELRRLRGGR